VLQQNSQNGDETDSASLFVDAVDTSISNSQLHLINDARYYGKYKTFALTVLYVFMQCIVYDILALVCLFC